VDKQQKHGVDFLTLTKNKTSIHVLAKAPLCFVSGTIASRVPCQTQ